MLQKLRKLIRDGDGAALLIVGSVAGTVIALIIIIASLAQFAVGAQ